jgi:hypothetical protein
MNEQQRKLHDEIAKKLTDEGRLIEIGWATMNAFVLPPDASPTQRAEMRKAFFCGAQHLYASIMGILEPGAEPTDKDLERMSLIHHELEAFRKEVTSFHTGVKT